MSLPRTGKDKKSLDLTTDGLLSQKSPKEEVMMSLGIISMNNLEDRREITLADKEVSKSVLKKLGKKIWEAIFDHPLEEETKLKLIHSLGLQNKKEIYSDHPLMRALISMAHHSMIMLLIKVVNPLVSKALHPKDFSSNPHHLRYVLCFVLSGCT